MSAFTTALAEFLDAIRGPTAWVEELNDRSQDFAAHLEGATRDEVNDALRQFAGLFPNVRPVATGHVGISCGSLVERGGDPELAGPALLTLLPRVLEGVVDFYRLCRERVEADPEIAAEVARRAGGDQDYDLDAYIADESWDALAQRFGPFIFKLRPVPVLAHMAEHFYCLGVIAHLSRSKGLRALARVQPKLLELALAASPTGGTTYLATALRVLDDERLIVLHPGERKGYEVRISALADNFQLHTLLADALIGDAPGQLTGSDTLAALISGARPDPAVVAAARDGPIPGGHVSAHGHFNLWNWPGLKPDGTLPAGQQASSAFWIWNEGHPDDIMPFEGVRVVLLGQAPYLRHWSAGRSLPDMPGELNVERTLTPEEVSDWLARIAAAPRPAPLEKRG
jgi:hypothetical protein